MLCFDETKGRAGLELLRAYTAQPLDRFEGHRIILEVIQYFSEHYSQALTIHQLSRNLGISLIHIETAFDLYKGKKAHLALLDYRLSRLYDLMSREPSEAIGQLLGRCGLHRVGSSQLAAFPRTNAAFVACFGIDLVEFHQQCCLAELARLQRQQASGSDDPSALVGSAARENVLLTRFHRTA